MSKAQTYAFASELPGGEVFVDSSTMVIESNGIQCWGTSPASGGRRRKCRKRARAKCLTCFGHKAFEQDAQKLRKAKGAEQ